jgi:hypothetical protein
MKSILAIAIANFLATAQAATYSNSSLPIDFVHGYYPDAFDVGVFEKCPHLNFGWKSNDHRYYPKSTGQITSASDLGNNEYEITLQFSAENCPPISNLDQAAIIGVNSPESSSYYLYDSNQKIYNIQNSCNWAAKFVVYGQKEGKRICVPNFQIHYSWFSGLASSSDENDFPYHSAYEYSTNCASDNNDNAQSDFPQYCFEVGSDSTSSLVSKTKSTHRKPTASLQPETCVPLWSQCDGQNWSSDSKCCDDAECKQWNEYYAQCVPKSEIIISLLSSVEATTNSVIITFPTESSEEPSTAQITPSLTSSSSPSSSSSSISTSSATLQVLYGQCGGKNWNGPTVCIQGAVCSSMNPWYYQCLAGPTPTTTSSSSLTKSVPKTTLAPIYGQCGGLNWIGPTACVQGTCSSMNKWYSQCVPTQAAVPRKENEAKHQKHQ